MSSRALFSINTVYHLMITKLYIRKKQFKSIKVICNAINNEIPKIINADSTFDNKLVIDRKKEKNNKIKNVLLMKKNILKLNDFLKKNSFDCVVIFKDNDIINQIVLEYAKKNNIKTILIEEGLGIYALPKEVKFFRRVSLLKQLILSYPKKYYNIQGINPLVDEIYVHKPELLPKVKKIRKKIRRLDFSFIEEEEKINLFNYFYTKDITHKKETGNWILYLGQPFSEINKIDILEEQNRLNKIFSLFSEINFNILIKPHPSENVDKYKNIIKNNNSFKIMNDIHVPVELIPLIYNVHLIMTYYSTASYYLNRWYGITVISIAELLMPLDEDLKAIIEDLYNVEFIRDFNNLRNILR